MSKTIVMIGLGEMGGVFARGFLKAGYTVVPVNRQTDSQALAKELLSPSAVVVSVGEKDLDAALENLPEAWKDNLVLLQNELLPNSWKKHGLNNPTVISVWFEKKPGQDVKVIISSPVYGPAAIMVSEALGSIGISTNVLSSEDELLKELVIKNVYILTTNIAGLSVGGNVGELWNQHQEFARAVANDVMDIQFVLAEKELEREELIQGMVAAFEGDLEHKCMGRSAPARLERALKQADESGLEVKKLKEIAAAAK